MRRFCCILGWSIGLAACRIEPTPERYIDPPARASENASVTETEIRNRLASLTDALRDDDAREILNVLAPHPDGMVIGPGTPTALPAEQLVPLLRREAGGERPVAGDLVVAVDSANRVAWFLSRFVPQDSVPTDSGFGGFSLSGVFIRQAGEWRLVQAHVSRNLTSPPDPPQAARP